jgi:hypothetical protein
LPVAPQQRSSGRSPTGLSQQLVFLSGDHIKISPSLNFLGDNNPICCSALHRLLFLPASSNLLPSRTTASSGCQENLALAVEHLSANYVMFSDKNFAAAAVN